MRERRSAVYGFHLHLTSPPCKGKRKRRVGEEYKNGRCRKNRRRKTEHVKWREARAERERRDERRQEVQDVEGKKLGRRSEE